MQILPFFDANLTRIARCVRADKQDPAAKSVRALDLLEGSSDPEARRVLDVYRSVPASYRRLLPAEAFCLAAGVSPWQVLDAITVVAVRQTAMVSAIVAFLLSPRVVERTVERALQDDGIKEMVLFHKATGFLSRGRADHLKP